MIKGTFEGIPFTITYYPYKLECENDSVRTLFMLSEALLFSPFDESMEMRDFYNSEEDAYILLNHHKSNGMDVKITHMDVKVPPNFTTW